MKRRIKKTIKISYLIDSDSGITSIRAVTDEAEPIRNIVLDEIIKHPRKVHHTASHIIAKKLVHICRRMLYAAIHIKIACGRDFIKEDIPRHQYSEPPEIPTRINF